MISFRKYGSILLGAGILAFGIYNIHARCEISEGGVLGISLLLYHWLGISPGISNPVMDCIAILIGARLLQRGFLRDSLAASASYALCYGILERFPPLLPDLSELPAAAAAAGGLFVGVGTALIVRQGCAAGADDSLALIVHRKTGLKIAVFYLLLDSAVLLLSLSYIPVMRIGWSLLSVLVSSAVIAVLCRRSDRT